MKQMKQIIGVYNSPAQHWVGDGFPVRSLFSYSELGEELSPFLLLDHAGPHEFGPTSHRRGVGQHPHRGFETVTIVYDGEVEHRDSTGAGGIIGPGDVQWMTAGAGILHEEFHSDHYAKTGGPFEMAQLWVNLPAEHKLAKPGYQGIVDKEIPAVALADDAGVVRVIAGEYLGNRGPAHTFSAMDVWDLRLNAGKTLDFSLPAGRTLAVVVLAGEVEVSDGDKADGKPIAKAQMAVLTREGEAVSLSAKADSKLLILSGEPLDEPIVGYGPFVMNTHEQIAQAIQDFNNGRFGRMSS